MKLRNLYASLVFGLLSCVRADDDEVKIRDVLCSDDWVVLSPIIVGETGDSVYAVKKSDLKSSERIDSNENLQIGNLRVSKIKEIVLSHVKTKGRPNVEDIQIQEISLNRIESQEDDLANKWFYVVTFALVYDGFVFKRSEEEIYLLSDGKIVPFIQD